jgi:ribosomal protein RSM22 (predicted rRNA methylase)
MYDLPSGLAAALKQYAERADQDRLGRTTGRLIDRYQADHPAEPGKPIMNSADDALAYAAYRMPATYAAIRTVLGALPEPPPEQRPNSHLDVAGGTGAALWAVADRWPEVGTQTVLEQSEAAISLGRLLCGAAAGSSIGQPTWRPTVLRNDLDLPPADLITIGYLLSEIDRPLREAVIRAALRSAEQMLIIVEPGTVAGYQRIIAARDQVISAGWLIAAPCPHEQRCPLRDQQRDRQQDWCHFSARLQRTAVHRRIKGAELGYEDEKFCYLVAVPRPVPRPNGRVLRHPRFAKGRVDLQVCQQSGHAERVTVAKRDQQKYRAARKVEWGDGWPPDLSQPRPGEQ